jgi:DNA repair exonuclease SbcCD ATPase subunit
MPSNIPPNAPKRHITHLRLENFQNHRDTQMRLDSGVNLITGSSDSGKSAVLRAINLVLHNQPRGKTFVRKGATEARVTITFSDDTSVTRIKGERNAYVVRYPNGYEKVFDKIGSDVPEEVRAALGSPPEDDPHGPLSYCDQRGRLFLTSLSAVELPRSLSMLTRIDDFEEAAQALGKIARQADRQARDSEHRIAQHDSELESYGGLDASLLLLEEIKGNAVLIALDCERSKRCREFQARGADLDGMEAVALAAVAAASCVADFGRVVETAAELGARLEHGQALSETSRALWELGSSTEEALAVSVKVGVLGNECVNARASYEMAEAARRLRSAHATLMEGGLSVQADYLARKKTLKELIEARDAVAEEARDLGLLCAACDQPVAPDHTHAS